jgi:hypothetical protein
MDLDLRPEMSESRVTLRLQKGWNSVLLEVVRPEAGVVAFYAAFFESEPPREERYVPLVRWFREPQRLTYDIAPRKAKRIGWYRFKAPPGVRTIQLQMQARRVRAWIDGETVSIESGTIHLTNARRAVSQIALQVEQEPGSYAGAAFSDPVTFECDVGEIHLGDWSPYGLATYSGIGVYTKEVSLSKVHLLGKVFLDLGQVRSIAEVLVNDRVVGVTLARPFRFDVSEFVEEGKNKFEIKVANTLANHMSTYPTQSIASGQTVSGLLGPVQLLFYSTVEMIAEKTS